MKITQKFWLNLGYDTLKDDGLVIGSNPSIYSNESQDKGKSEHKVREDLYSWMVKQDSVIKVTLFNFQI